MVEQYGKWAVVAGASEGLGAAFAQALAKRGFHLILIARRAEVLAAEAERLRQTGVEVRTLALDLGNPGFVDALLAELEGRELGIAVYNAAYSYMAPFLREPAGLNALGALVEEVNLATARTRPTMLPQGGSSSPKPAPPTRRRRASCT